MASSYLFEKYKQGYLNEESLTLGLKFYDRRYFYLISMAYRLKKEDCQRSCSSAINAVLFRTYQLS